MFVEHMLGKLYEMGFELNSTAAVTGHEHSIVAAFELWPPADFEQWKAQGGGSGFVVFQDLQRRRIERSCLNGQAGMRLRKSYGRATGSSRSLQGPRWSRSTN